MRSSVRSIGWLALGLLLGLGVATAFRLLPQRFPLHGDRAPYATDTPSQTERDGIYSLLAYALVHKAWESQESASATGYNIGALLVDPDGRVVEWARNAVTATTDATEHAELRLMTGYLASSPHADLRGFTLYTTLEPCAMCAGMMTMTSLFRTMYGQADPRFGKAIERLQFDSREQGGLAPYPRRVVSDPSPAEIRSMLEAAYRDHRRRALSDRGIIQWLFSDEAKAIFEEATNRFLGYEVSCPENEEIYQSGRLFYETSG